MAKITVSNLKVNGSELFQDSESFLQELTNQEVDNILGGWYVKLLWSCICFGN